MHSNGFAGGYIVQWFSHRLVVNAVAVVTSSDLITI